MAAEADNVSSVSASACHIGGPIGVNPGELTLVYGIQFHTLDSNNGLLDLHAIKIVRRRKEPFCRLGVLSYSDNLT